MISYVSVHCLIAFLTAGGGGCQVGCPAGGPRFCHDHPAWPRAARSWSRRQAAVTAGDGAHGAQVLLRQVGRSGCLSLKVSGCGSRVVEGSKVQRQVGFSVKWCDVRDRAEHAAAVGQASTSCESPHFHQEMHCVDSLWCNRPVFLSSRASASYSLKRFSTSAVNACQCTAQCHEMAVPGNCTHPSSSLAQPLGSMCNLLPHESS